MKKILVAGGNGQLGKCLQKISTDFSDTLVFRFTDSSEMDITDTSGISDVFDDFRPDYCINASAYTAVDLAESEEEKAYRINAEGVGNLAEKCSECNAVFIHISTDYVFDGETEISYDEESFTNPKSVYGASKLKGEELALENNSKSIVIRTSWLYSEFNKNFVKTMLQLFETKEKLTIVADQFGQPTNANDLAEAIMEIISSPHKTSGVFHYSNYPETTWFDFAKKIAEISSSDIVLEPIDTKGYPTAAKRPQRSTMDLTKIQEKYSIEPKHWEHSLQDCLEIILTKS